MKHDLLPPLSEQISCPSKQMLYQKYVSLTLLCQFNWLYMIRITIGSIFQYLSGHSSISIQLFIPSTNRRIPLSAASCSAPKINFPLSSDWNAKVERIISFFAFLIKRTLCKSASGFFSMITARSVFSLHSFHDALYT